MLKSHVAEKELHGTNKPFTIDTTFLIAPTLADQEIITIIITTTEIIGTALILLHDPDPDPDPETTISLQQFLHKVITKRKLPTQMPLVLLWTSPCTVPITATTKAKLQPIQMTSQHWIVLRSKKLSLRSQFLIKTLTLYRTITNSGNWSYNK